jgi:hypothetical protein
VQPDIDDEENHENTGVNHENTGVGNNNIETTGVGAETTGVDNNPPAGETILPTVETIEEDVEDGMDTRYDERSGQHNLRPRKRPNDKYINAIRPQDHSQLHSTLEHYVMTQHSVKKGLRLFGDAGKDAVYSEMQQLHEMEAIEPKRLNMLTREEKRASLHYLMFLKQKRCGRSKGRGCADGRKQ